MEEIRKAAKVPHSLVLENREKLELTGIQQVESFDEQTVVLQTPLGQLMIKGEGLHISQLNVDSGELSVSGNIIGVVYSESSASRGGIIKRLFR